MIYFIICLNLYVIVGGALGYCLYANDRSIGAPTEPAVYVLLAAAWPLVVVEMVAIWWQSHQS